MKQNFIKKHIFHLTLIALIIFGVISLSNQTNEKPTEVAEPNTTKVATLRVSLSISGLYENESVSVESDETVLEMLEKLNTKNTELKLATKDYGAMGVLIEGMGGQTNGIDNKYWQYEVNGETPMIGADKYELKNGDSVVWEFKASEY